ncbi:basic endochitinase-like [Canna indica]|uniref:chitinase n=1 Tax=Canna indica TaxID=4628 RepID=A0AAQ3QGN6_9LILI|nr:basic endochitinase-like [Canna indica]
MLPCDVDIHCANPPRSSSRAPPPPPSFLGPAPKTLATSAAGGQGGFYTYDAFIAAADAFTRRGFATTGDVDTRKRELAAFFAQTSLLSACPSSSRLVHRPLRSSTEGERGARI